MHTAQNYQNFKKQIPTLILPLFEQLRNYCLTLGNNIVEDIRAHRIVFGKSISFRWFADLEPTGDRIVVKIQKGRKEPAFSVAVNSEQQIQEIKKIILEAYNSV